MSTPRPDRAEDLIQIIILLLIGVMAGAASFTHVHDWTMRNVPAGTGGWFGWANAVISELTPTAAGLEIRRRKRQHRPIAYPMTVLIAAASTVPLRSGSAGQAQPHRLARGRRPGPGLPRLVQARLLPHHHSAHTGAHPATSSPVQNSLPHRQQPSRYHPSS